MLEDQEKKACLATKRASRLNTSKVNKIIKSFSLAQRILSINKTKEEDSRNNSQELLQTLKTIRDKINAIRKISRHL